MSESYSYLDFNNIEHTVRIVEPNEECMLITTPNSKYVEKFKEIPDIEKVIFNDGHTIVLWTDKTKTVVACQNGEEFDPEKGFALAFMKKYFGNTGKYFNIVKKWCGDSNFYVSEKVEDCENKYLPKGLSLFDFFGPSKFE